MFNLENAIVAAVVVFAILAAFFAVVVMFILAVSMLGPLLGAVAIAVFIAFVVGGLSD